MKDKCRKNFKISLSPISKNNLKIILDTTNMVIL